MRFLLTVDCRRLADATPKTLQEKQELQELQKEQESSCLSCFSRLGVL